MDAVMLARIQFAMTVGFHYLFPPLTFGLTLMVLVLESLYLKKGTDFWRILSSFFIKILGLVFVVGVATGITMEFSFGTNWSEYSRMVGDVFGAPLAAEALFSFFLESVFMGVLIFGRPKVHRVVYWFSALCVFVGSHLSGLWILIANSWMQTPQGHIVKDGVVRLADFWAAAFNPSTMQRVCHTTVAGWVTGAFFAAGICAWYLYQKRHQRYALAGLKVTLVIISVASSVQFFTGHMSAVQVAKNQPAKMAAFEALWETQKAAPLALFGWPDSSDPTGIKTIAVPGLLSFLIDFDMQSEIKGLKDFMPREEFDALVASRTQKIFDPIGPEVRPPVAMPFYSYHVMITLGSLFVLFAMVALFLWWKNKLNQKWFLILTMMVAPLPELGNQVGWIATEVGRQPWAIYRILPTSKAASVVVSRGEILFSLVMFSLIYTLLFVMFVMILCHLIKKGPEELAKKVGY